MLSSATPSIFSERYVTVGYLAEGLKQLLPDARIASTVRKSRGNWQPLDHDKEVEPLIRGFAPYSNRFEDGTLPKDKHDVFVTTDAYAEGVNLQDSSVLISYDIAWSADVIIQCAGRVMRFWKEPRKLNLYCFTTDKTLNLHVGPVASRPSQRLKILEERLEQATHLTEINILPEEAQTFARLGGLSKIKLEDAGKLDLSLFEAPELSEVSSVLEDLTQLNNHKEYANALPNDISTVFSTPRVQQPILVSLVRANGEEVILSYNPTRNRVAELSEDQFFRLIRCEENTPVAGVDASTVESLRHQCLASWLGARESKNVQHICSAYLLPEGSSETLLAR